MALLPPSLYVGVIYMSLHVLLRDQFHLYERILFVGLKYIAEPSLTDLIIYYKTPTSKKTGPTSIRLFYLPLDLSFFASARPGTPMAKANAWANIDKPFLKKLDHSLCLCAAFLLVYTIEAAMSCLMFPQVYTTASFAFGVAALVYIVFLLLSIVWELSQGQAKRYSVGVTMIVAFIPALLILAAPDDSWISFNIEAGSTKLFGAIFQIIATRGSNNTEFINSPRLKHHDSPFDQQQSHQRQSAFDQHDNPSVYIRILLASAAAVVATSIFTPAMRFAKLFSTKLMEFQQPTLVSAYSAFRSHNAPSNATKMRHKTATQVACLVLDLLGFIALILLRFPIFSQHLGIQKDTHIDIYIASTIILCIFHLALTRSRLQEFLHSAAEYRPDDSLKSILQLSSSSSSSSATTPQRTAANDTEIANAAIHYRIRIRTTASYIGAIAAFYILPAMFVLLSTLLHVMYRERAGSESPSSFICTQSGWQGTLVNQQWSWFKDTQAQTHTQTQTPTWGAPVDDFLPATQQAKLFQPMFMSSVFDFFTWWTLGVWAAVTVYGLAYERFMLFLGVNQPNKPGAPIIVERSL